MKFCNALGLQAPYLVDCDAGGNHLAGLRVVIETRKPLAQPIGNARTTGGSELLELRETRDRKDARYDWRIDASGSAAIAEVE